MKFYALPLAPVIFFVFCALFSIEAFAAPPSDCVILKYGSVHKTPAGITYNDYLISSLDGQTRLHSAQFTFSSGVADFNVSQNLAQAASLLMLSTITSRHDTACTAWLLSQGKEVLTALSNHHENKGVWQNSIIENGDIHIGMGTFAYRMQPFSPQQTSRVTAYARRLTYQNVAYQEIFPSYAQIIFDLPAYELPALMSSTGGQDQELPAVHASIKQILATRDSVKFEAAGQATITGNLALSYVKGDVGITNMEALIEKTRKAEQMRLTAALVLSRFVSHRGNNKNSWKVTWEGGVLTVNGFPVPMK